MYYPSRSGGFLPETVPERGGGGGDIGGGRDARCPPLQILLPAQVSGNGTATRGVAHPHSLQVV
jgi:hypothetical protein